MTAATLPLQLAGQPVTVKELTVAEVRAWFVQIESGLLPFDLVDELLHPEASARDMQVMSDASPEQIEGATAAELDALVARMKVLNPHFFAVRAAVVKAARMVEVSPPAT